MTPPDHEKGVFAVAIRADGDLDVVFTGGAVRAYVHMTTHEVVQAGMMMVRYGLGLANAPATEGGH